MAAAHVLIVPADRPEDPEKLRLTLSGPLSDDSVRVLKVLRHLFGTGEEWDGPIPNVEVVVEREIEAA